MVECDQPAKGSLEPFPSLDALVPQRRYYQPAKEETMLSCDYNGWADVPEDEREGVDAFELTRSVLRVQIRPLALPVRKVEPRPAA